MQGKKDYQEKLFIWFQLSDYVPADNFYRQLKSILDLTFLYDATAKYYGTEGQKSIDPVVFFKLMLIGYLENLNSDRRIISSSRMRMDILYFLGYDLDEELPWHSTLSRTRNLYGREEFLAIFKKVLKLCIDKGLISGKRQAVDSVLVRSNTLLAGVIEKQVMDDARVYSEELDSSTEQEPVNNTDPPDKSKPKRAYPTNKTHYSPTDPDARFAVKPGKPYDLYYRAQVGVDTANHCITHIQAFHADNGDSRCFPEVVHQIVANMQDHCLCVEEVMADGSYSSLPVLQMLEDYQITGYIPNIGGYKSSREGFTYDKEHDRYTCSQGVHLPFRRMRYAGRKVHKIYHTRRKDCKNCPIRSTCANPAGIKSIEDAAGKQLYDQMHERLKGGIGKKMANLRSATVEPVLGTLVNFTAMKRMNTRGIALADKCMITAAIAYNLKKLIKRMSKAGNFDPKSLPVNPSGLSKRAVVAVIAFLNSLKIKEQTTSLLFAL
jgi:transposase